MLNELQQLRGVRLEKERRAKEIAEPPVREIKRDRRHIPGLLIITSPLSKLFVHSSMLFKWPNNVIIKNLYIQFFFTGLTVEQSTDLKVLTQELYKLERQYKELNISYRTRFQKKDTQMELKEHLSKKVGHR